MRSVMSCRWSVRQAVKYLRQGQIIAYPTEAVYGLGCNPLDELAVQQLLVLKDRPWQKGVILIAADLRQMTDYLQPLSDEWSAKIQAPQPHPTTWLVPARPSVPYWLRGNSTFLAVRITQHALAAELCRCWGMPLVSTSANPSGRIPARTILKVRSYFGDQLAYVLPGQVGSYTQPSQIRYLFTDELVRA